MNSTTIGEIAKALSLAQSKMEFAGKDSSNPFFKSKYADLTSIIKAAKKELADNGLAITQIIEDNPDLAKVTTMLMHTSGEWISSTVALKPKATDPQAMGSAITYARRYGYAAIIGLSADDDDGNAASQKEAAQGEAGKSAVISDKKVSQGTCENCHAPLGKMHATSCTRAA